MRDKQRANNRLGCRSAIWGWLATLFMFLLFVLYACLGDRVTLGDDVELCDPVDHADLADMDPIRVADNAAYVPNQIIVTGTTVDIERVWAEAVDQLPELRGTSCLNKIATGDGGDQLDSDLYEIPPAVDEWDAVAAVYQAVLDLSADGEKVRVFADPNYVIGMEIEGDPVNGHGGLIGSLESAGGLARVAAAAPVQQGNAFDLFRNQWAFEQMAGGLPEAGGDGIEVAIFDTSSYTSGEYTIADRFTLTVREPDRMPLDGPDTSDPKLAHLNVADHGVFAAGLVNGMAPNADIVLVRVLNDTGQGTLRDLLAGLEAYNVARNQELADVVVNLSLGLGFQRPAIREDVAALMARVAALGDPICEEYLAPDNRVPSLQNQMAKMRTEGATIVAAAGNDSLFEPYQQLQLPANFDQVIGVAANNIQTAPSCFTNAGQLSAPGGDGDTGAGLCQPKQITALCAAQGGDCIWALISTVNPATYESGYAYWIGTSFATPLVAGLSAQIMSQTRATTPEQVEGVLMCAATGAAGPLLEPATANPTGAGIPTLFNALDRRCAP